MGQDGYCVLVAEVGSVGEVIFDDFKQRTILSVEPNKQAHHWVGCRASGPGKAVYKKEVKESWEE